MNGVSAFIEIITDCVTSEGISLNQFAKRISVTEQAVSDWMNGKNYPSVRYALKVAQYMDCSLNYLFGLSDEPSFIKSQSPCDFLTRYTSLLQKHGLSAYALARQCRLNQAMLSKWKRGKYPKIESLIPLCHYFGVTLDYLVGREN